VSKIKELSPTNDDLWLKFMEVMKGTKVIATGKSNHTQGVIIRGTQRNLALGIVNMTQGGNNRQLEAILKEYNGWYRDIKLTDIMAYDLDISE
ncbi:MAG: hypothetical protein NC489_38655, partial [Ruminococcus flavefaciens]|nr:hypothetical protein [Ruminococcus flavefaciens]